MKNFEQDFSLPPFPAFPSTSRYVEIGPVSDAVARVSRSIAAREAISLLIGPPGTGKSLVCGLLANLFADECDVVVMGETSIPDAASFYRFLLHRLGVAFDERHRDELEWLVNQRLSAPAANPKGTLLIIDEAASLSTEVLECVRGLTNIMQDECPMVSAVVAGGVKLDETLASPSLESFVQRVTARCYLHPLNSHETSQYIKHSIEACDASADETISDAAIASIHCATAGVPRLINQLMTEAIDCSAEMEQSMIDERAIDQAWANLQQLPGPMIEEPNEKPQSSVIEFGELSAPLPLKAEANTANEIKSQILDETLSLAEEAANAEQATSDSINETLQAEIQPIQIQSLQVEPDELVESTPDHSPADHGEPTTDPAALFGVFEEEEQIDVGTRTQQAPPQSAEVELESMLHSQIVSLSQFAADNTVSRCETMINSLDPLQPGGDCLQPGSVCDDDMDAEFDMIDQSDSIESKTDSGDDTDTAPSVVWYDEPHDETDSAAEAAHDDDSDLLWITEDIDVQRRFENLPTINSSHRIDSAESDDRPRLNVDYREILEKMRHHA